MKVYPHQFVDAQQGKLGLRYNPLLGNPVEYRASATVSRFMLERQVLAEHVSSAEHDNDPRINRLWSRFHKDLRATWAQNGSRSDRVPIALAIGFCVEAVRNKEADPQVLHIVTTLLSVARRDGIGKLDTPRAIIYVRPEIDLHSGNGVFSEIKGLTTSLLTRDAEAAVNRGDFEDITSVLCHAHRQLGNIGSALVTKSRNMHNNRSYRGKKASTASHKGSTTKMRSPLKSVQAPARAGRPANIRSAIKQNKKSTWKKAGVIVDTVEERAAIIDDAITTAAPQIASNLIAAVEADLSKLDNRKLVSTFGTGLSQAEQHRLHQLNRSLTFIEWQHSNDDDGTADVTCTRDSYVSDQRYAKEKALVSTTVSAEDIVQELEKLLAEIFPGRATDTANLQADFEKHGAPHGVWTELAKRLARAWDSGAAQEHPGSQQVRNRGVVLRHIVEDLWQTKIRKRYAFCGKRRQTKLEVQMATRSNFAFSAPVVNSSKGICSMTEAAQIVAGDLECPQRVLQSRPIERKDITVANLTKADSPFFNVFCQQDVDEAAARALGCHRDGECLPDVQVGRWGKFTTPGLQKRAATQSLRDRGYRLVRTRHPAECAVTHAARLAANGTLAQDAISASDGEVKTLRLRATLCSDHGDILNRSMGVGQVAFNAADDAESESFFAGVERRRIQEAMTSSTYPVYLFLGIAEAGDGYDNIENPLLGVLRRLLFEKAFEIKNDDGSVNFQIFIEHCGCGSFTADEKARALALCRTMGGADVFSFSDVYRAGYMDYHHLHTAKVICVEDIWEMSKDYFQTFGEQHGSSKPDQAKYKEWLEGYPGFAGVCRQLTGTETLQEIEQMYGSAEAPLGAPEMLHALAAVQTAIYAMYNCERGDYQQGLKAAINSFVGTGGNAVAFMDTLSANKAKVVEIMVDPVKACGDFPPRSGFDEFCLLMFYSSEIYCLCNLKEPTRQNELALIQNGYGFFCLTVDLVEMGHWREDEAHSVISKYFIQLGYFAGRMYGIPSTRAEDADGHRLGKVRLRDFLGQIFEAFMSSPRCYGNDFSNHGASTDGMGFDELNPLKHIMLRWDAEQVFKLMQGCPSSHSVRSRSNTALSRHRQIHGEHDAFLPMAMLEHGRAAQRFLPTLKEQLASEKNVDGSARFIWNRDIFVIEGVGLVGMTVTQPPPEPHSAATLAGNGAGRHPLQADLSLLQRSLQLHLRCQWKKEKKILIDESRNLMTYSVTKTVRRVVCGGRCVETQHHPKGDGENVLKDDVKSWVESYWRREAEEFATDKSKSRWQDWSGPELKRRQGLRTKVKTGRNKNKTSLSYLRAHELVEEFLRLERLYPEPRYKSPMPCPRRTLRFPVETSWRGSGQRWPAEFEDARVVTQAVAEAMEDAGETLHAPVERVGADGVSAGARMAQLTGEELLRPVRRRVASQRVRDARR